MAVRNLGWYNSNESRPYPLDDAATFVSDAGGLVPFDVVVDLNLRYPNTYGEYAFVSALTVSPNLVTVVIEASDADGPGGNVVPVASASVAAADLTRYRQVPLAAMVPGAGGWVCFGAGAESGVTYSGRFSSPAQSKLTARAARAYAPLPVKSLGAAGGGGLAGGVVRLRAQAPLVVSAQRLEIAGVSRTVALVELSDSASGVAAVPTAPDQGVLAQFAGPCLGTPESGTCGDPAPVETLDAVSPDCNGVITLEFQGCADPAPVTGEHAAVLDCALGLAEACLPPYLPDENGNLPDDLGQIVRTVPPPAPPSGPGGNSESSIVVVGLPFSTCFEGGTLDGFTVKAGEWQVVAGRTAGTYAASTEGPAGYAQRNVLVWSGLEASTLYRKAAVDLMAVPPPLSSLPAIPEVEGGIVFNYQSGFGLYDTYWIADINFWQPAFRLLRFNGTAFVTLLTAPLGYVFPGQWYHLELTVVPGPLAGQASVTARVTSLTLLTLNGTTYPAADSTVGPFVVSGFDDPVGYYGVGAYRSQTRFNCFTLEDL